MKLTIADAAAKLGISKEAIYNRIRRNSLESLEEDGVRYVILDEKEIKEPRSRTSFRKNQNNDKFIDYLLKEIEELKEKNKNLLNDKEELYKQREKILIESKEEIKSLYKQRDEKLKYFLELIEKPINSNETDKVEIINIDENRDIVWVEFSQFLSKFDHDRKIRKKVKDFLIKNIYSNSSIMEKDGSFFVDESIDLKEIL